MAHKNKLGSTDIIKSKLNNLGISWDYDTNPKKRYPVLLFTPDLSNTNDHHHIPLNRRQAKVLRDWLDQFLKDDVGTMRNALRILTPDLRKFRPKRLMAITGLGQTELSKLTGKARPLLYEKELPLKLSSRLAKAIFSLVILTDLAFELFGGDENETKKWLMSPNTLLFGDSPFLVSMRGESNELINWLNTRLRRKPGAAF